MIGTSTYDYLFIQLCILGLHYVAPLCISYCLIQILRYGLGSAIPHRLPFILELWTAAETIFYIAVHLCHRQRLQSEARHPPAPSRKNRRELFALCDANIPDPEAYLRKWFLGAPAETIKRDNLKEFFLWAFFDRGGLPGDEDEELEEYIVATERLLGRKVEEGRGSAVCLRLTLDPANMLHRSLLWYWCVGFVDFLTFCRLQYYGFHFHRTALSRFFTLFPLRPIAFLSHRRSPVTHLTYWHRPHTSRTKLPIVFIHGIGIGLYPYVDFLNELSSASGIEGSGVDEQVGIIAVELMPVSFRITNEALGKEEICDEIQAILEHHGFAKYVLVAHSYGSAVATYLLKSERTASQIGPVVLIDPITILLHLPDVAYNFTRRQPITANEHQLYYFASMDMGVSHTLARRFFWSDVILWKEDLGNRRVTFSLAERDLIVDTEAVGRYLASSESDSTSQKHDFGELDNHAGSRANDYSRDVACNYVNRDRDVYVRGRGTGKDEHNGKALHDANTNGIGFLAANGCIGNGQARVPNGHVKVNVQKTELIPAPRDWKSRPWQGKGLEILWQHGIDHAQVFDSAKRRKRLISAIGAYNHLQKVIGRFS